ncbi:FliH/SctL family protein [Aestuariibius sp. 2305UL40-4]|uniref:FliH/SctL family protein n=1 Tax=Aestuariibius violaceus TaxID=3234132 RepID=UPI00345F0045
MRRYELPKRLALDPPPIILTAEELALCTHAAELSARAADEAERWTKAARFAFRKARRDGWAEGYDAGLAEARATIAEVLSQFRESAEQARSTTASLALDIARKVVGDLPDTVSLTGAVTVAIREHRDAGRVVVAMPAATPSVMRACIEALVESSEADVRFEVDAKLESGRCELRTPAGIVDVTPQRQLQTLAALLAKESCDV